MQDLEHVDRLTGQANSTILWMKEWLQLHLPELNELAGNARLGAEGVAAILSSELLTRLPPVAALSTRETWQVLMILGCCGSSVERHAQQERVRRGETATPGTGLGWLIVRGGRQRFVEYFQQAADLVGHPYRDTFCTFVEHNGPAIRVFHPETGNVIHVVPAAFDDGAYLTFSDKREERQFILLLKECAALQGAANLFLEKLQAMEIPLHDRAATDAAMHAGTILLGGRAKLQEFMARSQFSADFFLDVLRQYACLWSASNPLRPPSGANDATALQRDVILFTELIPAQPGFPGFRSHVRQVFSILTEQAATKIDRCMRVPSMEAQILKRLGRSRLSAHDLTPCEVERLLVVEPWLAAYVVLFEAQRQVSRTHYATVLKYLVRPKQIRDLEADPRERVTIVANTHGTTGMEPLGIMRHLDLARANHFLSGLAQHGKRQVRRQLEEWRVREYRHTELLALCQQVE